MLGTNIFSSLFTGVSLLMEGMLFSNLLLCLSHPQLAYDVLGMSIFSMTGKSNICLFLCLFVSLFVCPLLYTSWVCKLFQIFGK